MFYYDDLSKPTANSSSGHFEWNYSEFDKCHLAFGGPTWCMTENMANATYRAFNVPHHTASYWAMYHVSRNYDKLKTAQPWQWYLRRAGLSVIGAGSPGTGLMDGTVFREVLDALKTEGAAGDAAMQTLADTLDKNMNHRQQNWEKKPFPYGSEFGFDTTGQEEVVVWNMYYGNNTAAKRTVDHVLSYMRSSPTWAYNGGSRSWGDVGNNGKYMVAFGAGAQDRGNMHYRSGLNMIPLIEWYRAHPEEGVFLLEVSMGAITGQMCNIDEDGAGSMMWHAMPYIMDFDPHSGDYGLGFFGHALESGAYYVIDKDMGELCYLCDVIDTPPPVSTPTSTSTNTTASAVTIVPRDTMRRRVFIEPLALYLVAEAGVFESIQLDMAAMKLTVNFNATEGPGSSAPWSKLRLKLDKTSATRPGNNFQVEGASLVRGAYEVAPAAGKSTSAFVTWSK
jgi:hypothetical protein